MQHQQNQQYWAQQHNQNAVNITNYDPAYNQAPPAHMQTNSGQNQSNVGANLDPSQAFNVQMATPQHSFLSSSSSFQSASTNLIVQTGNQTQIVIQDHLDDDDEENTTAFP